MRLVLVRRVAVVKTIAASKQSFDAERSCFTLPLGTGSLPLLLNPVQWTGQGFFCPRGLPTDFKHHTAKRLQAVTRRLVGGR
jgi:hypothetical protein